MAGNPSDTAGAQGTPESAAAAGSAAAAVNAAGAAPAKPAEAGATKTDEGGAAAAAAPAAEKPGGTGAEPGQPAGGEPPKAPEKYSLTVPTGDEKYVDDRVRAHIERVAKASGWSNDDAQAALEEFLGNVKAEHAAYLEETKADEHYGGDKLEETQRLAKVAIDRLRPVGHARRDSFLAFVNRAGAFNHIEVVSFLADLGRLMAEDRPASGGAPGGAVKPTRDVLYDKTASAT